MQVLDREALAHLLSGLRDVRIPGGRRLRAPASIMVRHGSIQNLLAP